jgi:hypothetical protein
MKYAYIVVEGPHDVEFIARLLKPAFTRIRAFEELDATWRPLVPTKFPHRGDLLARVPSPTFLRSATHSLALHSAQGIDNIKRTLEESWIVLTTNSASIDGVGVVLDADDGKLPAARHTELRAALTTQYLAALSWPATPATIALARRGPGSSSSQTAIPPVLSKTCLSRPATTPIPDCTPAPRRSCRTSNRTPPLLG